MFSILKFLKNTHKNIVFIIVILIIDLKSLNIYQLYLFVYNSNITGMPLHSVAHVLKGYTVNNLVDI